MTLEQLRVGCERERHTANFPKTRKRRRRRTCVVVPHNVFPPFPRRRLCIDDDPRHRVLLWIRLTRFDRSRRVSVRIPGSHRSTPARSRFGFLRHLDRERDVVVVSLVLGGIVGSCRIGRFAEVRRLSTRFTRTFPLPEAFLYFCVSLPCSRPIRSKSNRYLDVESSFSFE